MTAAEKAIEALRHVRHHVDYYTDGPTTEMLPLRLIDEALAALTAEPAAVPPDREAVARLREAADKGPLECACHGDPDACICSTIIALCDAAALRTPASEEVEVIAREMQIVAEQVRHLKTRQTLFDGVAMLRRLSPADGWRPIESAPKDKMVWTLWDGVNQRTKTPARYYAAAYHSSDADYADTWIDESGDYIDQPTHWRPLPAPPSSETEEK